MFVLTEWGEVSVGGKLHPRPQHLCPVFSRLFNFLCAVVELVGTWGVFTVVSSYTCNCIVSDPVTSSCSSPNTRVHLYVLFYASAAFHLLTLNISVLWSGRLPHLWLQFSFFFCIWMHVYVCVCVWRCMLLWSRYVRSLYWCCLMSFILTSSDPQAAQGAGRFPGKGFRPDDTAECQCKDKHANCWIYVHVYCILPVFYQATKNRFRCVLWTK